MLSRIFGRNVHPIERAVRVVLGLGFIGLAVSGVTPWGYLGVIPLLTGLVGNCPLYGLLGFSTCPVSR